MTHDHKHPHGHSHDGRGGKICAALRELFAPHNHDASDSIDGALESSAAGIRAVKISLLALGATSIAQLVIVAVSGSVALLADTIHNFADALTAIPLWIASHWAPRRQPAATHTGSGGLKTSPDYS